ncbi:MAG: TSUP family transporter [Alteromonadaceae bacterium]|nr:TSUP family transporter [Alteromonadaceae bacterium]
MTEFFILFAAGLLSGTVNAIAGGGSFISFPALVFVGIPPVFANATNTFASCAGYMSGAYAFREELLANKHLTILYSTMGILGGAIGGVLLLQFSNDAFSDLIPWLLLFATVLFVIGPYLSQWLKHRATRPSSPLKANVVGSILMLLCSIYGGFFNAGLGIILLSVCALMGLQNMALMNGLKLLVSVTVSLSALVVFVWQDMIAWYLGSVLLIGNMAGAYLAARISKFCSDMVMRNIVLVFSIGMTMYFFLQ